MASKRDTDLGSDGDSHMRLRTTRELYAYWNRVRRGRFAPWRSEIEPVDIHRLLPDVFIAEQCSPAEYRFRLAGTRMCATYRKELKGRDFLEAWSDPERDGILTLLHNVASDGAVGVIGLTGRTETGKSTVFELTVMPLRHHDGRVTRFIGALAAEDMPYWVGSQPIMEQTVDRVHFVWPEDGEGAVAEAVNQGPTAASGENAPLLRRKHHLTLYQGGRLD